MNTAPILIVDDDTDDWEFLEEAWKELEFTNQLKFFKNAKEVLNYLKEEEVIPFLIISDVNLPGQDGFQLKKKLLEDDTMNYKSIPFVFFSNSASDEQVKKSFDLGSNGFFIKGKNIQEIKNNLSDIVKYWQKSKTPE